MNNAIVLINVSKKYTLTKERPLLLKNLFIPSKKEEIWALKDVSLEIKKGETIGIIGENGSGKSTLLKIISGITTPTSGAVKVNGRVASLIELGAGFQPDLTGKENVYLNGTLLGLTKKEIDKKYTEIVDFADIPEFIDQPVRTYSSGMTVRLGFSVAVHLDPDILLIDEVLAVGDEEFQKKCINKIKDFEQNGKTILLVSHNLSVIFNLCKRTALFTLGRLQYLGNTKTSINTYISYINKLKNADKKFEWGSKEVEITNLSLIDKQGNARDSFDINESLKFRIFYRIHKAVKTLVFGLSIHKDLSIIFGTNSQVNNFSKNQLFNNNFIDYSIKNIPLTPGKYLITVAAHSKGGKIIYNWCEQRYCFEINSKRYSDKGYVSVEGSWQLGKN